MIESWAEPRGVSLVCVTDDPLKDFATPKPRLGTVHIRHRQRIPSRDSSRRPPSGICRDHTLDDLDPCLDRIFRRLLPQTARA